MGSTTRDAQRQGAAERMRNSRARKRLGFTTVYVDVHRVHIGWLVSRGLLAASAADDLYEIGYAVQDLLDELSPARATDGKP
jgi:hypothetical protein